MAKYRDPLSIHAATRMVHACLGDAGVEGVTGKSSSIVQKWSDPDLDGHHIPLYQAIALDCEMVRRGMLPKHLEAFVAAVEHARPQQAKPEEKSKTLSQHLADIAKEFGDYAHGVVAAEADGRLSKAEKARLTGELEDIKNEVNKALRALR